MEKIRYRLRFHEDDLLNWLVQIEFRYTHWHLDMYYLSHNNNHQNWLWYNTMSLCYLMQLHEMFQTIVIQSNGIQQSGRDFTGPRRSIPFPWLGRDRFGNNAAQSREIDKGRHFLRVSKCT